MPDLLIVASPTTQPLCTDVAIPTDGQPQWWRCSDLRGPRRIEPFPRNEQPCPDCVPDGPFPFTVARWAEVEGCDNCRDVTTERDVGACGCGNESNYLFGAIVELVEVTGPSHRADECCPDKGVGYDGIHGLGCGCNESWQCSGKPLTPEGQSTAGEHCECWSSGDVRGGYVCCRCGDGPVCGVDARREGWHTPTGTVTRLSEPIPCERPWVEIVVDGCTCAGPHIGVGIQHEPGCGTEGVRASVWPAGKTLAARLRERHDG